MLKTVLLATVALVAATPAIAADFTGPRAEARLGWDRSVIEEVGFDDGTTAVSTKGRDDGFGLGAEVGYDIVVGGKVIVGAYAGAEWATTKECSELFGADEVCLKLGRNFTLGARAGAMVTPQALLYIKAGYSNGQLKATYRNTEEPALNATQKADRDGFHVGLGGEYNVSDSGYIKLEAVRTNYNDADASDGDLSAKLDARRTQVVAGFGLRF